jgi:hypothetical protein
VGRALTLLLVFATGLLPRRLKKRFEIYALEWEEVKGALHDGDWKSPQLFFLFPDDSGEFMLFAVNDDDDDDDDALDSFFLLLGHENNRRNDGDSGHRCCDDYYYCRWLFVDEILGFCHCYGENCKYDKNTS